jgi:uncharacterized protein with PQ loop repeat
LNIFAIFIPLSSMLQDNIWTSLSGISGSISLASWIVVLLPQLIENYRTKSYHAISERMLIGLVEMLFPSTLSLFGSSATHSHSLGTFSFFFFITTDIFLTVSWVQCYMGWSPPIRYHLIGILYYCRFSLAIPNNILPKTSSS